MSIFSKIFGGAKAREEEKDQEYMEYLLEEVEKLKEQKIEEVNKEKEKTIQEKKAAEELQAALEQVKAEKAELERQFDEYKEKAQIKSEREEDKQNRIEALEKKLSEYEMNYDTISKYFTMAKSDAEKIVTDARQEAEQLTFEKKREMEAMRFHTEAELQIQREENIRQFEQAKQRVQDYLHALNRTQAALIENYNELGRLVEKMPLRLEDVFSKEAMKLLDENKIDENKKTVEKTVVNTQTPGNTQGVEIKETVEAISAKGAVYGK